MEKAILIGQIVTAILLIVLVLIQNRSSGLGSGSGASTGIYQSKRGMEKIIFVATILATALFLAFSIISVI